MGYGRMSGAIVAAETWWLSKLETAVAARDWKAASEATDRLRLHGWRYAQLAEKFGAEAWENYSQEMDAAESECDE